MCNFYRMCNIKEEINEEKDSQDEGKETILAAPEKLWAKF